VKNQKGFTLLEVVITLVILGTLTVATAQAIQQAIKAKNKLDEQIDDASRMRDALKLMERDINLAYHHRDIEKELNDLVKKSGQTTSRGTGAPAGGSFFGAPTTGATTTSQDPPREAPRRDPVTNFMGTNEAIDFVTMNGARTLRNAPVADFIEVGYILKECKNIVDDQSSKCLWRRTTPYVDLDVTKGGDEVVLVENITEFKLRYIGKGKQDWVNEWKTDESGDGATKGRFPTGVEISLTMTKDKGSTKKKYSMQLIVPVHFPNNPEETNNNQSGGTNGQQGNTGNQGASGATDFQ
jgi:prepilin-type N-terminal cleavage/methylation domain